MVQRVKLFKCGRSQALRLPVGYRFEGCDEVFIRRDPESGNVILSRKPQTWDRFFKARQTARRAGEVPEDFLSRDERKQAAQGRDPFEGWQA